MAMRCLLLAAGAASAAALSVLPLPTSIPSTPGCLTVNASAFNFAPEGAGGGKSKSPTARALRSYQSRFRLGGEAAAEAGVVGGADLDAVIREASEASRELRERHPMLLAEFAAEWALGRTEAEGDD